MSMFSKFKREVRALAPLGIPAVFSQLAQMAMGFIDTVMAGHYSNDALAAIAIGTSLLYPVIVFFMGTFLVLNPIVAHFQGAAQAEKIKTHFHLGIVLAVVLSPLAVLSLLNMEFILAMLNIDPAVAKLATGYLHATVWGMPMLLLFFALRYWNEGMFSTMAIMVITISSIPFNVALNYWFMYGGYGLESMGAVGVGYATGLIWVLMCLGMIAYSLFAKKYASLKLFKDFHCHPMALEKLKYCR